MDSSASFPSTSTEMHPLGELYQRWALDYVVEATLAFAQNQIKDPDSYAALSSGIRLELDEFYGKLATTSVWPNFTQRVLTFSSTLGTWFSEAAGAFRSAVVAYVERTGGSRQELSDTAMTDAVWAFRTQIGKLDVAHLAEANWRAKEAFDAAVRILCSRDIADHFGVSPPAHRSWPFGGILDANGAELIDRIARAFFPEMIGRMSGYKFMILQRVAHHGAITLSRVVQQTEPDTVVPLRFVIEPAYTWCLAVRELMPVSTIVSAWRREQVRQTLSSFDQSLLPGHPAGNIQLTATEVDMAIASLRRPSGSGTIWGGNVGLDPETTNTIGDGVCCSTGDLSCTTDASCLSVVEHCQTEGGCPTDPGSGLSCGGPCGTPHHHC